MKTLIVLFAAFSSMSAFASSSVHMNCRGIDGFESNSLTVDSVSATRVPEGTPAPYSVTIKDGEETLFSGNVSGTQKDVQLFLRSYRGTSPRVKGTIFLDDAEQSLTLGHIEMRFECSYN